MTAAGGRRARRPIAAAAMLGFELNGIEICGDLALNCIDRRMVGESTLVASVVRRLTELHDADGRLITFDGLNDLAMIRFAAFRYRQFRPGGAATWLRDLGDAHDDVMQMLDASIAGTHVADFMAGICGRHPDHELAAGSNGRDRAIAEFDAVQTLTAYLHILAERRGSIEPLAAGVAAIANMIAARAVNSPHLTPILRSELFKNLAPATF